MRNILVVNAGSSGIKYKGYKNGTVIFSGAITCAKVQNIEYVVKLVLNMPNRYIKKEWIQQDGVSRNQALTTLLDILDHHGLTPTAIGHRVVHGGKIFSAPTLITPEVRRVIEELCAVVPLHNTVALGPITIIGERYPNIPQVAVFDTAFHRTIHAINQRYALPDLPMFEGIERYGFHGISYEFIAGVLPEYMDTPRVNDMVIVAHIGSGASMCLLRWNGVKWESSYCTLGFGTSGNGPLHATRAVLDGDAMLEVVRRSKGRGKEELVRNAQAILLKQGGLKGLSGYSDDLVLVASAAHKPDHKHHVACQFAVDMYFEKSIESLGMLAAKAHAHGRLRAVVWTAGVGEHAPWYRTETARAIPGLKLYTKLNTSVTCGPITTKKSKVLGLVIPTDEEQMIAQHTAALLEQHPVAIAAE